MDRSVCTWKAHYVAGWDPSARQYRALLIDGKNWGAAARVTVGGDHYVMVSPPYPTNGGTAVARMILRVSSPDTFVWTKDISENGGPWRITEEARARAVHPAPHK